MNALSPPEIRRTLEHAQAPRIAFHVHVDGLWTYQAHLGHEITEGATDAAYSMMMPRIIDWADRRGARLTLFVVGKDLQVPRHAALVRNWHDRGHEIANHSWSHRASVGLSDTEIRTEIVHAHDIISDTIGQAPVGYTAPGWYDDARAWPVLNELAYEYDCSLFPSWLMMALPLVVWWWSPALRKTMRLWRSDWRRLLLSPNRIHYRPKERGGLRIAPAPVTYFRLPLWHSLAFSFPQPFMSAMMKRAIALRPASYYYVVHPLDLMDPKGDLSGSNMDYLRARVDFARKRQIWDDMMQPFESSKIVPMRELLCC